MITMNRKILLRMDQFSSFKTTFPVRQTCHFLYAEILVLNPPSGDGVPFRDFVLDDIPDEGRPDIGRDLVELGAGVGWLIS